MPQSALWCAKISSSSNLTDMSALVYNEREVHDLLWREYRTTVVIEVYRAPLYLIQLWRIPLSFWTTTPTGPDSFSPFANKSPMHSVTWRQPLSTLADCRTRSGSKAYHRHRRALGIRNHASRSHRAPRDVGLSPQGESGHHSARGFPCTRQRSSASPLRLPTIQCRVSKAHGVQRLPPRSPAGRQSLRRPEDRTRQAVRGGPIRVHDSPSCSWPL